MVECYQGGGRWPVRNKKGFTLIEVIVVVAIIAILLMQYIGAFVPAALPAMTVAGHVLIVIATFFTVVSGIIYIKDNRDVMKG